GVVDGFWKLGRVRDLKSKVRAVMNFNMQNPNAKNIQMLPGKFYGEKSKSANCTSNPQTKVK
ncbi:unnamed protein product, partial [Dovyalis caffra]